MRNSQNLHIYLAVKLDQIIIYQLSIVVVILRGFENRAFTNPIRFSKEQKI